MADDAGAPVHQIYNYRWLGPELSTAGQPLEDELRAVAAAGFQVVINLALLDAEYSLPDEAGLVRALGMDFEHIPVIWEQPTLENLREFAVVMQRHAGRKIFLHCAANMRASVFLALYRTLWLGWRWDEALPYVHDVWEPDSVWSAFIQQALATSASK